MWVRGLKLAVHPISLTSPPSHPMWVRGLKLAPTQKLRSPQMVAPHVGAWIETHQNYFVDQINASHPMWVRGLKQT